MSDADWVDVLAAADLNEERLTRVSLGDDGVLLYRTADTVFAVGARCTHVGMRLDDGRIVGAGAEAAVTCPAHGSRFRLSDGRVLRPPAQAPLPSYDVREVDGRIQLRPR